MKVVGSVEGRCWKGTGLDTEDLYTMGEARPCAAGPSPREILSALEGLIPDLARMADRVDQQQMVFKLARISMEGTSLRVAARAKGTTRLRQLEGNLMSQGKSCPRIHPHSVNVFVFQSSPFSLSLIANSNSVQRPSFPEYFPTGLHVSCSPECLSWTVVFFAPFTPTHGRRPPPLPSQTPLNSLHLSQGIEATNAANLAQVLLCSHITSWSLPESCVNLYPFRCRLGLSAVDNPPSTDPDIPSRQQVFQVHRPSTFHRDSLRTSAWIGSETKPPRGQTRRCSDHSPLQNLEAAE